MTEAIQAEGLHEKVSFRAFVRANLMTEEVVRTMKATNFTLVRFGAETGSEELLKKIKGANVSMEDAQRTIDLAHKYKIPSSGSFMFGIPGETRDDLNITYNFLKKNRKKNFKIEGFYAMIPFHGTEMHEIAKSKGLLPDDNDLDFTKFNPSIMSKSFTWDRYIYLNEENIPFNEFKKIMKKYKKEFGPSKFHNMIVWMMRYKYPRKVINYGVKMQRRMKRDVDVSKFEFDPSVVKELKINDIM